MKLGLVSRLTVAAVITSVAGCGVQDANAGAGQAEPELGTVPQVDSYDDLVFPLDSYHLSQEQQTTIIRADDVLVRECMRRYGFDYEVPDRSGEPELENRVIGVVDKDLAAQYGYKPAGYQEHANRVKEAKTKQPKWTPEMMSVLNGNGQSKINGVVVPEGGCSAEARTKLGMKLDGNPGDENMVLRLEAMAGDMAEADSRLKAAWDKWSTCMADAGYNYRDPWQANNDPAFGEDVATQQEIDTAITDVTCRAEHNVNGIWVAVRTAYQKRVIAANADELRNHQTASAEQLQKATNVLATQ